MKSVKSWLILIICAGVFLQILGAPISFWDLDDADHDFTSSLLVGACVQTENQHISPFYSFLSVVSIPAPRYSYLHESFLLHPPIWQSI